MWVLLTGTVSPLEPQGDKQSNGKNKITPGEEGYLQNHLRGQNPKSQSQKQIKQKRQTRLKTGMEEGES